MKTIEIENSELIKKVNQALETIDRDEYIVGIRFENKLRKIGEICEPSKDNSSREDERDFPEYGTDEYKQLDEMAGTSSWDIDQWETFNLSFTGTTYFNCEHIYIIGGYDYVNGPDEGEYLIKDAIILAVII